MKNFYPYYQKITSSTFLTVLLTLFALSSLGQDCSTLTATFKTYESRCAATGSIKVAATGGSGTYKYKVSGPVNTNFTSTDSITGLEAGTYIVEVKDITSNCTFSLANVKVGGNYQDIRFSPKASDITCEGAQNGSISLLTMENGRAPFTWTIIAPSAMNIGTSNNTGNFSDLKPGNYTVRMTDSCGGIQTRIVTIHDYTWTINAYSFTKTDCNTANGYIKVTDSKNNISTVGGIPGFQYGVVRAVGDTIWSSNASFTVSIPGLSSFGIVVKDACGKVKKGSTNVSFTPSVGASVNITNKSCNTFSASLTGVSNFFPPFYMLYNNTTNENIGYSFSGTFDNIPYGDYYIKVIDGCTNIEIIKYFSVAPPTISIDNKVAISNKNCNSFTASITGKVGLTNPTFYLYNSSSVQIASNNTGVFTNLAYGSYSIITQDGCQSVSIQRDFTEYRWKPTIVNSITPSYVTCDKFGINVTGDSLTSPTFCLYDESGTLILCNATGKFDSLDIGTYSISVKDGCVDTTITRGFTVNSLTISNDVSVITTNTGCKVYTSTVKSNNLKNAAYTLYTSGDVVVGSNSTGIFTNLSAGTYYVISRNLCPDTTFKKTFTITDPIPSVGASVTLSNYNCGTFTAAIKGQTNLTSPQYNIYDNNNQLVGSNTSGTFNNLSYGSYCIKITNSCYDTVITRCFTASAPLLNLNVTSKKSCTYGNTDFTITVTNGSAPYIIKVYNTSGDLLYNSNYNTTSINISNIPGIFAGQTYKVIASDNCNKKDSVSLVPEVSTLTSSFDVASVCPGDIWPNGAGKINADIKTNMGSISISIIKKNGAAISAINPTNVSGTIYSFDNLEPATYTLSWRVVDACSKTFSETVTVEPYQFPSLQNSSAYQCDVNGFTIGAAATKGVSPYTYEIIGSFPSSPSIIAAPQASPLFSINNSTEYSLIRLRALDACGNATLGDVSILPLANNKVTYTNNCLTSPTTLNVDPLFNSEYKWYKKQNLSSTDSTLVSEGAPNMLIPYLTFSDTGIYVIHLSVANGCIERSYYNRIDGSCYKVLSDNSLTFTGKYENEISKLSWTINEQKSIYSYTIERRNEKNEFVAIGTAYASGKSKYEFNDEHPESGKNFYRLKLNFTNQTFSYSDIISLGEYRNNGAINIFPNPVTDHFTIDFSGAPGNYKVVLMNLNNQVISQHTYTKGLNSRLVIDRNKSLSSGLYLVRVINTGNNQEFVQKIIFR